LIKRPKIGVLYKEQGEPVSYCPDCLKGGKKQKMEERIYSPDPLTKKTVIPSDARLWRQCHRCGLIIPIYNLKREGRLVSELKPLDNPFDIAHTKGIETNRLGKTKKRSREEDYYQDEDLKREIREGNQVLGYSES